MDQNHKRTKKRKTKLNSDIEEMIESHIQGVKIDWNGMIFLNQALNEHQILVSKKEISDREKK